MPTDSPTPARTPHGQRTRTRILSAATSLFAERGFVPVTIRAIGEAAGIDNSSLYRHFENKSAIARAVMDRCIDEFTHELGSVGDRIPPTLDGLVSVGTAAGMALWDRPDTARLILHLILGWRDEATHFQVSISMSGTDGPSAVLFGRFARAYSEAARSGQVRAAEWPEAFIALFSALVLRPATRGSFLVSQEPDRSDELARQAWRNELETLLRASLTP